MKYGIGNEVMMMVVKNGEKWDENVISVQGVLGRWITSSRHGWAIGQ